jgi:hypothetical protein
VNSILGNYEESNRYLEEAYIYAEDLRKNYLLTAASYITNASVMSYPGEDHENLLVLYYKALNYVKMNQMEEALVECRRMNQRLYELGDRYKSDKKYQRDAFFHLLMGLIYDANLDFNNAFIAYRNALNIYREDYQPMFGMEPPSQLVKDLIRTAHLSGFPEEKDKYEAEFGITFNPEERKAGDLVFIWNNGLSPVKSEWGLDFFLIHGEAGIVNFRNDEYNFNFPFPIWDLNDEDKNGLQKLEVFRVAVPKYIERPLLFNYGKLVVNGSAFELEPAENINAIARKVLEQRMALEFGKSLLRLALKKATEYTARDKNESLGTIIGILNAITEKADTRNWQTLPHSIYYSRVNLNEGPNEVVFQTYNGETVKQEHQFVFEITKGKTRFHTFHSLETADRSSPFYN